MVSYTVEQHRVINGSSYPGTRQLCIECDEPTGKCEEDTLSIEDIFPLCNDCYDSLDGLDND